VLTSGFIDAQTLPTTGTYTVLTDPNTSAVGSVTITGHNITHSSGTVTIFMPFITEELWHSLRKRDTSDCIIVSSWPTVSRGDAAMIDTANTAFEIVKEIRNHRNARALSQKEALELNIHSKIAIVEAFWPVLKKLSNLSNISLVESQQDNATTFMVGAQEFSIPVTGSIDVGKEREVLLKDLEYQKGFMAAVEKKLSNEKFVKNAPPKVIALERQKQEDAASKIRALEESLARL
jgi:valyl-tRNA synthetase